MLKERPVMLFFQENAGNMSHRLPFLRGVARMLNVAIFAPRLVPCLFGPLCLLLYVLST